MRLLALCADRGVPVDGAKGATVHLVELWRALARRGARVTGLAPWRGGALPATGSGLEIAAISATGRGDLELQSRLRREAHDHAHRDPPDGLIERLALGSRLGIDLRRRTGAPLVVEVNAPLDREATRFRVPAAPPDIEAMRDTLHAADHVYCVSRPLIGWALTQGARPGHVDLLANGVDVRAFQPGGHGVSARRAPRPSAAGAGSGPAVRPARVRVGFVGSFKPWHGLEHLIEGSALARARGTDLSLDLLGDGPERARLEARSRTLGLAPHVRFLGARPHGEVPAFLERIDIAVAPAPATASEDYYFSPLKLFEYAAAGCAIVAPALGQVPEWFEHGVDAWLVPPAHPAALADGLVRLANDPALRSRLGACARARAEREFDWAHVADRILGWVREARATAPPSDRGPGTEPRVTA